MSVAKKTYTAGELQEFEERLNSYLIQGSVERRFYMACMMGDLDTVIQLKNQIDITARDNIALIWAAECGHLDVVKYLHEQGADIHVKYDYAFRTAAENGYLDIVKYLYEQGVDIHAEDDYALRYAAEHGHLDVVKYLYEQGANIYVDNYCALRWAAESGHLDVVKYLHEQGADIRVANDFSLYWASQKGHVPVVRYILSVACDFDIIKRMDVTDWKEEHFKEFFSFPFMMQNQFMVRCVWDIVPQDKKTPAVIQHYQKNMTVVLLRNPLQQKLAVG